MIDREAERLLQSGLVRDFVKQKAGHWNHQDWLGFLASVRSAGYQGMTDDEIGLLLEQEKVKRTGTDLRSGTERQRLEDAERDKTPVELLCDNCGGRCKALGKPLDRGSIPIMSQGTALITAWYCDKCNIIVCGRCAHISSLFSAGVGLRGLPCPRCGEETWFASVGHARMTNTRLA